MCIDEDLMPNAIASGPDDWNMTCAQMEYDVSMGNVNFECNSTDMEFARFYCCEDYDVPECNVFFLRKKNKNKNGKSFFLTCYRHSLRDRWKGRHSHSNRTTSNLLPMIVL